MNHLSVQLADEYGVEHIITAATSATREAKNGEVFGPVNPGYWIVTSDDFGKVKVDFLAVRKAIDLQKHNALVIDIGVSTGLLATRNPCFSKAV